MKPESQPARATVVRELRGLLRGTGFRRLLTVRLLSQFADGVFQIGLATYVVFAPEQETSPGDIAAAMAVLLLPYSLLGPFAGVLLDRWRRRQVLFYGNLLRCGLVTASCTLILGGAPDWLFYLSALLVTAVNRFILAGLSAALPRVVDREQLVVANSLSPTAGTLAATVGGGGAFVVQLLANSQGAQDTLALLLAAVVYLLAGLSALRMGRNQLGPDDDALAHDLRAALVATGRGLLGGLRHLGRRRTAAGALAGVGMMRFSYGALLVTVLMLCRYSWDDGGDEGVALLGVAVGVSGAGFFVAAVLTPWLVTRLGQLGWYVCCALSAAVLVPALGLSFQPAPMLVAAFVLGFVSQSAKIVTDTVVQSSVSDTFRGRVFALYDMLYNIAFVGAAGVAALILPPEGRSPALLCLVSGVYLLTAALIHRLRRRTVSRETAASRETATDDTPAVS
ncbi:Major Facilitator Superfamily protein [Streptomyces zhaozhouensis]|uniref:Major Facilitator Superfamily protein n=1 Tax=Streptomyces zhaozhouensis TaxID=1300267 RepID=A0A286DYN6_9ACTN|nr:MFS transporter [Streptomyces zhaozhouensis]SOD63765.1 Major Facilitator Superfamily protein [Streptomyces zhaozhouensis]